MICPPAGVDPENTIVIDTSKGQIVIKLRTDIAPKHAERIKLLAREKYYDNVPFHRVIAGFMAQTGDGQNFNGSGGSKYPNLKQEFSKVPFTRGIVLSSYCQVGVELRLMVARYSAILRNRSGLAARDWSTRRCGLIGWLTAP